MNLFSVTEICSKVCFSKLIILALILRVTPYNFANNYMTENMFLYLVVLIFGIFSFLIILFWANN